jgi:hypothetical protein
VLRVALFALQFLECKYGARLNNYGARLNKYGARLNKYGARDNIYGARINKYGPDLISTGPVKCGAADNYGKNNLRNVLSQPP